MYPMLMNCLSNILILKIYIYEKLTNLRKEDNENLFIKQWHLLINDKDFINTIHNLDTMYLSFKNILKL